MTRVAAIDCGTNSIRLLVADVATPAGAGGPTAAGLTDLVRQLEIVRLGQDVDRTGRLAPEAIERTRLALAGYADTIRRLGAERVRMVATSASRDAGNAGDFQAMVRATLGVPPEVISGDEEARLSFAGAVAGLPAGTRPPYLVLDIGGGSTEFVRGGVEADTAISVNIGCVRMTERHLRSDPPTGAEIAAAEADIRAEVDRALAAVSADRVGTLVGLAGSVTTLAAIDLGLDAYRSDRIHHARMGYDRVVELTADLLGQTREERLKIPVMHPGRADVIAGGALVLRIIMERTGRGSVLVSEHDILDGIALSLAR